VGVTFGLRSDRLEFRAFDVGDAEFLVEGERPLDLQEGSSHWGSAYSDSDGLFTSS